MDKTLKEGLVLLLDTLLPGATSASMNWVDGETNYAVSATLNGTAWQLYASVWLTPKPVEINVPSASVV